MKFPPLAVTLFTSLLPRSYALSKGAEVGDGRTDEPGGSYFHTQHCPKMIQRLSASCPWLLLGRRMKRELESFFSMTLGRTLVAVMRAEVLSMVPGQASSMTLGQPLVAAMIAEVQGEERRG